MATATAIDGALEAVEGHRPIEEARRELARALRRHEPRVRAVCARILGDTRRAVEVARDVLREACHRLPELADRDRGPPWARLFRLAVRRAFDAVRRRGELLLEDGLLAPGSPELEALGRLSAARRLEALQRATAGLDPATRAAVRLRYGENLPHRVIDAWLDTTGSHARLLAVRADLRSALKETLL